MLNLQKLPFSVKEEPVDEDHSVFAAAVLVNLYVDEGMHVMWCVDSRGV